MKSSQQPNQEFECCFDLFIQNMITFSSDFDVSKREKIKERKAWSITIVVTGANFKNLLSEHRRECVRTCYFVRLSIKAINAVWTGWSRTINHKNIAKTISSEWATIRNESKSTRSQHTRTTNRFWENWIHDCQNIRKHWISWISRRKLTLVANKLRQ